MVEYGFKQMLAEANAKIATISVGDAMALIDDDDTVFIDVRETGERDAQGAIRGAVSAPRGYLELIADPEGPMHNEIFASGKRLICYCASGGRGALASMTLDRMGIANVHNLAGGFPAWKDAGGPTEG